MFTQHNNHSYSNISAVILAGGKQTRLESLQLSYPKALSILFGATLIERHVSFLSTVIPLITIASGNLSDIFNGILSKNSKLNISSDPVAGTGIALYEAENHINTDHLLICNADTLNDLSLITILDYYFENYSHSCLIVLTRYPNVQNSNAFAVDKNNRIIRSFEDRKPGKPPHPSAKWHGASTGIIIMPRRLLRATNNLCYHSLEQEIIPHLIKECKVYAFDNGKNFSLDIGVPERFDLFHKNQTCFSKIFNSQQSTLSTKQIMTNLHNNGLQGTSGHGGFSKSSLSNLPSGLFNVGCC